MTTSPTLGALGPPTRLPLYPTLLLIGMSFLPRVQESAPLTWAFWGTAAALLAWQWALRRAVAREGRTLVVEGTLRKNHYLQLVAHTGVFLYWGWYWPEVANHAWLIAAQVVFAYAFDMLLCWSRRDLWRLSFGPFPIVFSTNLFLWFRDDWFVLQFVMVGLGFVGKELFTWIRDGRRTHIFNPSGFSLAVFSIALIAAGQTQMTWGQEIALTLRYPEHMYLVIFLLGLMVQYYFAVTLMTLSAAATLCLLGLVYSAVTGVYFFVDTAIPIAVFLGLHLLVTDPSTSPRGSLGRIIFGALYGVSVWVLYAAFQPLGIPAFYDKLLCVPLLNLSVRAIDRFVDRVHGGMLGLDRVWPAISPRQLNYGSMAVWTLLFVALLGSDAVGNRHEGANPAFWETACEQGRRNACRKLLVRQSNSCAGGNALSCNELGILLAEGTAAPVNREQAATAFNQACAAGLSVGCANAEVLAAGGLRFTHGSTAFAYAFTYEDPDPLRDACDADDGEGCYVLALAYREGRGVARDPAMARELFSRSCELDWAQACAETARLYLQADGVALDQTRALELFARACDLGNAPACGEVAGIYLRGDGVPASPARAAGNFNRGCVGGDAMSCFRLGLLVRSDRVATPDPDRARQLIQQACDMGLALACTELP